MFIDETKDNGVTLQIKQGDIFAIDYPKYFGIKGKYNEKGWTFKGIQKFIPNMHRIPDNMEVTDHKRGLKFNFRNVMNHHVLKIKLGHRYHVDMTKK